VKFTDWWLRMERTDRVGFADRLVFLLACAILLFIGFGVRYGWFR
jgi:hypothetical protein